ncbi:hypothetical protein [Natrinema sp. DC36]|uniref:hypothetical protein n=1 Tax=Natrinema sp. DC36 TaxID=2878680 RepID=UPI001CEFEFFA|nr:hypothetical protein [Natrinema sp. DC36]
MPYLKHESGEATELRNSQILGDNSPLEFDEDGYAFVEDPTVADKLLAMHRHIERGGRGPEASSDEDEAESESGTEVPPTDSDPDREGVTYDPTEAETGTLPFNPEEHTNDEIEERVAEIDDEAALVALRSLEEEQKDRDGAKDAIDSRLDDLEE